MGACTVKTIIAGSRSATYQNVIDALSACHFSDDMTEVVSGCAQGADTHGETIARSMGIPVAKFPADWKQYGKSAGVRRNSQMAQYADALIAVWDGESRGTKNMIELASAKWLLVFVYRFNGGAYG
ncbi:MAG: DUF2493 domain-containing protein [Chryseobacterium sp.]|nr:MAG: DUF2493 domain-containing protein [Chryseobacterium sp.]